MFFPWKATLADAGDGDGGRATNHNKSHKITKKGSYENCPRFLTFFKKIKYIFERSSYIQKLTPNPINALKIETDITNAPKIQTYIFRNPKLSRKETKNF